MPKWNVEQSHLIDHPSAIEANNILQAVGWIRHRAAQPRKSPHQEPFGQIFVSVEEEGSLIRTHFINKHGDRQRFMRLRRQDDAET